jgi:hypothetical protein
MQCTEKAGVEATLWIYVQPALGLNLGSDNQTMLTEVPVASHSHDHFLPNHFKFIINPLSYHSM